MSSPGCSTAKTSSGVDLSAPVVVVDLSEVYRSAALGAVITCVAAALHGAWARASVAHNFLVIDEGWAVLQNEGAARFLQRRSSSLGAYSPTRPLFTALF